MQWKNTNLFGFNLQTIQLIFSAVSPFFQFARQKDELNSYSIKTSKSYVKSTPYTSRLEQEDDNPTLPCSLTDSPRQVAACCPRNLAQNDVSCPGGLSRKSAGLVILLLISGRNPPTFSILLKFQIIFFDKFGFKKLTKNFSDGFSSCLNQLWAVMNSWLKHLDILVCILAYMIRFYSFKQTSGPSFKFLE